MQDVTGMEEVKDAVAVDYLLALCFKALSWETICASSSRGTILWFFTVNPLWPGAENGSGRA
jgi:hypothetical protein